MAIWAFACRPVDGEDTVFYISESDAREISTKIRVVQVKVGSGWRRAVLDRSRRIEVDGMLVRTVVPDDDQELPRESSGDNGSES